MIRFTMFHLSEEQVSSLLTYEELIPAMERALGKRIVYKALGIGAEDVAAARLVWNKIEGE